MSSYAPVEDSKNLIITRPGGSRVKVSGFSLILFLLWSRSGVHASRCARNRDER